jgi:hypothetical protein
MSHWCEAEHYSPEQPDLPCPYWGQYKHNGRWLCEFHYRMELTSEMWEEFERSKNER